MDLQVTSGAEIESVAGAGPRDNLDRAYGAEHTNADRAIEIELKTGVRLRVTTDADLDYVVVLAQRLG